MNVLADIRNFGLHVHFGRSGRWKITIVVENFFEVEEGVASYLSLFTLPLLLKLFLANVSILYLLKTPGNHRLHSENTRKPKVTP